MKKFQKGEMVLVDGFKRATVKEVNNITGEIMVTLSDGEEKIYPPKAVNRMSTYIIIIASVIIVFLFTMLIVVINYKPSDSMKSYFPESSYDGYSSSYNYYTPSPVSSSNSVVYDNTPEPTIEPTATPIPATPEPTPEPTPIPTVKPTVAPTPVPKKESDISDVDHVLIHYCDINGNYIRFTSATETDRVFMDIIVTNDGNIRTEYIYKDYHYIAYGKLAGQYKLQSDIMCMNIHYDSYYNLNTQDLVITNEDVTGIIAMTNVNGKVYMAMTTESVFDGTDGETLILDITHH